MSEARVARSLEVAPAPRVASVVAYKVPRHPAPIDLALDANEGLTPPVEVFEVLAAAGGELLRRYPSTGELEAELARRLGVAADRVMVSAGGDDAIDRLCRAVLSDGRSLVLAAPTFEMIARYARLSGATVREVPWPPDRYPLDRVLAAIDASTALVAVVSPNNPTGQTVTAEELTCVLEAAPHAAVLVDLAYAEFGGPDLTSVALAYPNAVVLRTFSKAWGLAGARVGYVVGDARVIAWMRAAGAPFSVAGPSLALARAWLDRGADVSRAFAARVAEERAELAALLERLGLSASAGHANFVFARAKSPLWVRDALASVGIGVRAFPGKAGLEDALRITLPGSERGFARLTAALESALAPDALLLDMDGVIADASRSYRAAIVETARAFGVALTPEDVARAKQEGDANNDWIVTHRLVTRAGITAPFDAVKDRFEALYHGGLSSREELLCDKAVLERLAARVPLGIVTGRPRSDADAFLQRFEIASLFRAVVTMEDAPAKPDPAPVALAMTRMGASRAWMVGDTVDDIRAARAAGVVSLGVSPPGEDQTTPLLLAGAARVLASVADLEELVP